MTIDKQLELAEQASEVVIRVMSVLNKTRAQTGLDKQQQASVAAQIACAMVAAVASRTALTDFHVTTLQAEEQGLSAETGEARKKRQ